MEFTRGTREYPIQFWVDAFNPVFSTPSIAQPVTTFNPVELIKTGDEVRYGSYLY